MTAHLSPSLFLRSLRDQTLTSTSTALSPSPSPGASLTGRHPHPSLEPQLHLLVSSLSSPPTTTSSPPTTSPSFRPQSPPDAGIEPLDGNNNEAERGNQVQLKGIACSSLGNTFADKRLTDKEAPDDQTVPDVRQEASGLEKCNPYDATQTVPVDDQDSLSLTQQTPRSYCRCPDDAQGDPSSAMYSTRMYPTSPLKGYSSLGATSTGRHNSTMDAFFETFPKPLPLSSESFCWTAAEGTSNSGLWRSSSSSGLTSADHQPSSLSPSLSPPPPPPPHQRQHSSADSSYDSEDDVDPSGDLTLAKIVGDLVDSQVGTPEDEAPTQLSPGCGRDPTPTLTPTPAPSLALHEEINRTTSETLSAEYSEWNTPTSILLRGQQQEKSDSPSSCYSAESSSTIVGVIDGVAEFDRLSLVSSSDSDVSEEGDVTSFPDSSMNSEYSLTAHALNDPEAAAQYSGKLKFALKLGYSEEQVRLAIGKVGLGAVKNDFLNQLIRIGARVGPGNGHVAPSIVATGESPAKPHGDLIRDLAAASESSAAVPIGRVNSFPPQSPQLRPIVIDGSNVAMCHGNNETFSCKGIRLCIDWFRSRGHREITAFVPMWRKQARQQFEIPIKDREILLQLESERLLCFTPSRNVSGRLLACYDDRYILNLALKNDGIIVSNDNYRDLVTERPDYRKVVEERLLMFTFVADTFMPPDDPFGKGGPRLDVFLQLPVQQTGTSGESSTSGSKQQLFNQPCPYEKKCTYGVKCKYFHLERATASGRAIADLLAETNGKLSTSGTNSGTSGTSLANGRVKNSLRAQQSCPLNLSSASKTAPNRKLALCRTKSIVTDTCPTKGSGGTSFLSLKPVPLVLPESATQSNGMSNQNRNSHSKLVRQLTLNPYASSCTSGKLLQLSPSGTSGCTNGSSQPGTGPQLPKKALSQTRSWGNPVNSHGSSSGSAFSASFDLGSMQSQRTFSKSSRTLNETSGNAFGNFSGNFPGNGCGNGSGNSSISGLFTYSSPPPPKVLLNDVAMPTINGATRLGATQVKGPSLKTLSATLSAPSPYMSSKSSPPTLTFPPPYSHPPGPTQQEYAEHQRLALMMNAINERANAAVLASGHVPGTGRSKICSSQVNQVKPLLQNPHSHPHHHPSLHQSLSSSSATPTHTHQRPSSTLSSINSSSFTGFNQNYPFSLLPSTFPTQTSTSCNSNLKYKPASNLNKTAKNPKTPQSRPQNQHLSCSSKGHSTVTRNNSAPDSSSSSGSGLTSSPSSYFSSHSPHSHPQAESALNPNVPSFSPSVSKSSSNLLFLTTSSTTSLSGSSSSLSSISGSSSSFPTHTTTTLSTTHNPPPEDHNVWSYDQPVDAASSWNAVLGHAQKALPLGRSCAVGADRETVERRQKMFFHLSAIFPEVFVRQAMDLLPDETDPQIICAQILKVQKQ